MIRDEKKRRQSLTKSSPLESSRKISTPLDQETCTYVRRREIKRRGEDGGESWRNPTTVIYFAGSFSGASNRDGSRFNSLGT